MRRIDVGYAIIYIDDDGDTLKEDIDDFTTNDMVSDYYNNNGYLQWNYYLIIPSDLVTDNEKVKEIESNDKYTRKYIINRNVIDEYVTKYFPKLGETKGKFILLKGKDWRDANNLVNQEPLKVGMLKLGSWYRDHSMMDTLEYMDELRASLVKDPSRTIVFYTHISNESSIAEKKFKLFIADSN